MATAMVSERQSEYLLYINHLQELGQQHSTMGMEILEDLWELYSKQLFAHEGTYETWQEFCETEIESAFENVEYIRDFETVVDRVFRYVHECWFNKEYIIHPNTKERISVQWLIEHKGWIGKLISISQKFPYLKEEAEKREIFNIALTGTRKAAEAYGESRQKNLVSITLPCLVRINLDDTKTLTLDELNEDQYNIFVAKLGKLLDIRLD